MDECGGLFDCYVGVVFVYGVGCVFECDYWGKLDGEECGEGVE